MKKVLFLFGELNDSDIDWLISHGSKTPVAEGTVLIEQGQCIDALYIVLEGLFDVSVAGHDELIGRLGAGEILGELSFVDARAPSTTVRAAANSVVYRITRECLAKRLEAQPGFAARFYHALSMFLSHRLRRLTLKMAVGQPSASPETESADELNGQVLDSVYLAGRRFQRMLEGAAHSPSHGAT